MRTLKKYWLGLAAGACLASPAWSQVPGLPGAAAAVPLNAPAGASAIAAAPQQSTLWGFLGVSKPQLAACRDKLCKSQLGVLLGNGLAPVTALSGGIIPPLCPGTPSAEDLAKDPGSAEGAAAQIKKDEAAAKARRAAVRYLGTVDCHWWPQAQDALIGALLEDKNECVRYEAALALARGCCCTKATMKALTITVDGSKAMGNPGEMSCRVKEAARAALEMCAGRVPPEEPKKLIPVPERKIEQPGEPEKAKEKATTAAAAPKVFNLQEFYKGVDAQSMQSIVDDAHRVLGNYDRTATVSSALPSGQRSLSGIFGRAVSGPTAEEHLYVPEARMPEPRPVVVRVEQPAPVPAPAPHQSVATGNPGAQPKIGLLDVIRESRSKSSATPTMVATNTATMTISPPIAASSDSFVPKQLPADSFTPKQMPVAAKENRPAMANEQKMSSATLPSEPLRIAEIAHDTPMQSPMQRMAPAASPAIDQHPTSSSFPARSNSQPTFAPPQIVVPTIPVSQSRPTPTMPMVLPAVEPRPQVVESRPQFVPSRPQVVEIPPQGSGNRPQVVEIQSQPVTPRPQAGSAQSQFVMPSTPVMVAQPQVFESRPQASPARPQQVVVRERGYVPPQVQLARGMTSDRLLETLSNHPLSVEREEAAVALGKCDWRTHPELPSALAKAAVADSSILVRCACMKSLANMHADTPEVRAALLRIRGEGHPALSEEAAKAFEQLSP